MKKLDKISDFKAAWDVYDLPPVKLTGAATWNRRFQEAGYYKVYKPFVTIDYYDSARKWLASNIGKENYAIVNGGFSSGVLTQEITFYFQSEKDAVLFSLSC